MCILNYYIHNSTNKHNRVLKMGLDSDVYVWNMLVNVNAGTWSTRV